MLGWWVARLGGGVHTVFRDRVGLALWQRKGVGMRVSASVGWRTAISVISAKARKKRARPRTARWRKIRPGWGEQSPDSVSRATHRPRPCRSGSAAASSVQRRREIRTYPQRAPGRVLRSRAAPRVARPVRRRAAHLRVVIERPLGHGRRHEGAWRQTPFSVELAVSETVEGVAVERPISRARA